MGFGLVLYANAALQGAVRGMTHALQALRDAGGWTKRAPGRDLRRAPGAGAQEGIRCARQRYA